MTRFLLLALAVFASTATAFAPASFSKQGSTTELGIFGKKAATSKIPFPTFNADTERWEKNAADDGEYPYDAVGALLRHGPSPFITRLINADEYEQGVLKYMAVAKVSRSEATGNMDAKLNNAADWMYQKMEEKNGKPKVDYTFLNRKQAVLTSVWAIIIIPTVYYVVEKTFSSVLSH